jgi:hypothetical protein
LSRLPLFLLLLLQCHRAQIVNLALEALDILP